MRWSTWLVTAGVVCVAILLAITLPTPVSSRISGQVRCASGNPVVGIWVEAFSGGRGWADTNPVAGQPFDTSFQHTLPNGGVYMLSVGCGGTPKDWDVSTKSGDLTRSGVSLTCYDDPRDERYGTCV